MRWESFLKLDLFNDRPEKHNIFLLHNLTEMYHYKIKNWNFALINNDNITAEHSLMMIIIQVNKHNHFINGIHGNRDDQSYIMHLC